LNPPDAKRENPEALTITGDFRRLPDDSTAKTNGGTIVTYRTRLKMIQTGDSVFVKGHNSPPIVVREVARDFVVCTLPDGTPYRYPHYALELVDAPESNGKKRPSWVSHANHTGIGGADHRLYFTIA
jgi:hypothetical protein